MIKNAPLKEELEFANETLNFLKKRKENLEKKENLDDKLIKLRRVETSIKAIEYYFAFIKPRYKI